MILAGRTPLSTVTPSSIKPPISIASLSVG
ncbi:UNVERIFIED_CONTAM: hypothetical protein GTU68_023436 [Idotea baltica]|nr:hypothetical protein [Idotea baltica]